MNSSDQIRFYYATSLIMLTSIIWTIIISFFTHGKINFVLFIITLISTLISRFLYRKQWNIRRSIIVPIILVAIYEVLTQDIFLAAINVIFVVYVTIVLIKEENESINYDRYKRIFTNGIYGIFIAAIAYGLFQFSSSSIIYRAIIIYAILAIITMREARGYCYNIKKSKSSKTMNLSLVAFAILLTQQFFYEKFVIAIKGIYSGFNYVIELIIDILMLAVGPLITWCIKKLSELFNRKGVAADLLEQVDKSNANVNVVKAFNVGEFSTSHVFEVVMKILVILVLALILFKLVKSILRKSSSDRDNGYVEVVESIVEVKKTSNKILKSIKKIFRKRGTPREEVLYRYGEFVEVTREKEIFKEYMTPKQLANIVKIKVDNCEEVDEITNIFNEAKFSTHNINRVKEQKVEKNVDNISKKIKKGF